MKRIHILSILFLSLLFGSCQMNVDETTLDLTVLHVQSKQAHIEIFPKSNEFFYMYGAVKVEEYRAFKNDRRFIEHNFDENKELCRTLNDIFAENNLPTQSIEELLFYNGAVDDILTDLEPSTDYYLFAYCLNERKRPIHTLVKKPFTTPAKPHSDITFDLRMADNETIVISPSNQDTYLWDIISKEEVFKLFLLDPNDESLNMQVLITSWFYHFLQVYYQENFNIPTMGRDVIKLSECIERPLKDGDVFFVGCIGYSTEATTPHYLYKITYHTSQPSVLEEIEKVFDTPDTSDSDDSVVPALNLLRRNSKRLSAARPSPHCATK